MNNYSLISLIKNVIFIGALSFSAQGCALLHIDNSNFDDFDGPNSGNPYSSKIEKSQNDDRQVEENAHQNRLLSAISHQDIILGMDQSQVMAAWGSPRDVETAGNSGRAERWLYYSGNSLNYGMDRPRIVYFENGHVVGWESAAR